MGAPKGNQYYLLRSKDGKEPIYSPEELAKWANDYFNFCINTPLQSSEIVKYKDHHEVVTVPKLRAFTIKGLCVFLDISDETFSNYSKREEYIGVTTRIRNIIYTQKFEGAAADLLNQNIIARDIGLVDRKDHTTGGQSMTSFTLKIDDD